MRGVCAFDIDNTLTCGNKCNTRKLEFIKKSIAYCRDNDMNIVINTARPPQSNILEGIDKEILKIIGEDVKVYSVNRDQHNIPLEKLKNNVKIANDNNVDLQQVVLIDDRKDTCDFILLTGSSTVHVKPNISGYGIDENEFEYLKTVVDELNTLSCEIK